MDKIDYDNCPTLLFFSHEIKEDGILFEEDWTGKQGRRPQETAPCLHAGTRTKFPRLWTIKKVTVYNICWA